MININMLHCYPMFSSSIVKSLALWQLNERVKKKKNLEGILDYGCATAIDYSALTAMIDHENDDCR